MKVQKSFSGHRNISRGEKKWNGVKKQHVGPAAGLTVGGGIDEQYAHHKLWADAGQRGGGEEPAGDADGRPRPSGEHGRYCPRSCRLPIWRQQ